MISGPNGITEHKMEIKKQIRSMLNEASLYETQGLYDESKGRYVDAIDIIKQHAHEIDHHKEILSHISNKLKQVIIKIERMENESTSLSDAEYCPRCHEKQFLAPPGTRTRPPWKGHLALAGFGQYESALEEFTKLLKSRVNTTRCIQKYPPVPPGQGEGYPKRWTSSSIGGTAG